MIVESLKKSILKYAITGKLSTYNENDTNINDTLAKIKQVREELYNNKVITKQQYIISKNNDEYKFELPEHWALTQIGYLGYVVGGGTPRTEINEYWGNEISWITPKDMKNFNDKYVDVGERSITSLGLKNSSAQLIPKGSILCSSRAPIGYLGISKNELTTNQGFKTLVPLCDINPNYVYYYLMARVDDLKKSGDGTTFSEISGSDLSKFYIAIPSLEEQGRIVNKIEELFEKLEEMVPIEKELTELKTDISSKLKYSILNYAIEGKLLENDKSLKPLLENNYDIPPFQIPDNWKWVKIDDVLDIQTGLGYKKTDQSTKKDGTLRVLRGGNINNNYQYELKDDDVYVANINKYIELLPGDILTPSVTSIEQMGKVAYIDKKLENITAGGFVYIIRSKNLKVLDPKYAMYFISSKFHKEMCKLNIHKSGQAFYNLKKSGLIEQPIPIPPLEEQTRIVDKIEQVLPLLNDIENLVNR